MEGRKRQKTRNNFGETMESLDGVDETPVHDEHYQDEWIDKNEFEDICQRLPIHIACGIGLADVVQMFLDTGCQVESVDRDGLRLSRWAYGNGRAIIVQLLIAGGYQKKGADVDGLKPIPCICDKGHVDIVRLVLGRGRQMGVETKDGLRPIHWACYYGHVDVVQLLLDRGCQMEEAAGWDECRPIHWACINGHADVVRLLLDRGCQMEIETKDGLRPIHWACWSGHAAVVELLLDRGCQMELEDWKKFRPIHWACENGHSTVVQLLLDRGCQMEVQIEGGSRPIHCACYNGHAAVVQLLLDRGCQMEIGIWDARRPIHLACGNGHAAVVKLLLDRGCQMEAVDWVGWRPIHWASRWGYDAVVQLLLDRGCQIETVNMNGQTPLDLANRSEKAECSRMLQEAQKQREKDEFQIFHLKAMTAVCRKYKIFDFPSEVRKVQKNVFPLNRPILFCDSITDKRCLPLALVAVEIVSDQLQYQEYVVVDKDDSTESVRKMIKEMRNWDIECSFDKFDEQLDGRRVTLEIETVKANSSWKKQRSVSFVQCGEGSTTEKDTLRMLFDEKCSVEEMKTVSMDSLKFLYSVDIQKENRQENEFQMMRNSVPLKRFLLVRRQLMTFYDKARRKLQDKSPIMEVVDEYDGFVSIEQKCTGQMKFISSTADTISSLLSENTMVAICVTEDASFTALLRKDYQSAKDIKEEISRRIDNKSGRVMMAYDTKEESKIIDDDVGIADVGDAIRYFVVSQFVKGKDIKTMKCIGSGAYGKVYECSVNDDEHNFVMKKIKFPEYDSEDIRRSIDKELVVASRIGSHPRIMKYLRFLEDEVSFYILMQRMETSLTAYIKKNKPLCEMKIIFFTKQILDGVDYLHDNKIIHRDIKGDNILLDKSENVKLTDFGISKCLTIATGGAQFGGANTGVGTFNYTAPEIIATEEYGLNADIWSVGATMIEMITGKMPFHGLGCLKVLKILRDERTIPYKYPSDSQDDLKQLVDSCLTANPRERPDCKELLSNSIFKRIASQ